MTFGRVVRWESSFAVLHFDPDASRILVQIMAEPGRSRAHHAVSPTSASGLALVADFRAVDRGLPLEVASYWDRPSTVKPQNLAHLSPIGRISLRPAELR